MGMQLNPVKNSWKILTARNVWLVDMWLYPVKNSRKKLHYNGCLISRPVALF